MDETRRRHRAVHFEYGDFQTPCRLAREICEQLSHTIPPPRTIVEPTCGTGSFLLAAADTFPSASALLGIEIQPAHAAQIAAAVKLRRDRRRFHIEIGDSLRLDWQARLAAFPEPRLVLGNPPWVTNAALGRVNASNRPAKSNRDSRRGIEAMTGKSNFDISEWLIREFLTRLDGQCGAVAMLCKKSVARKLLAFSWNRSLRIADIRIHEIDAAEYFGASVDACLFVCVFSPDQRSQEASVYRDIASRDPKSHIGWQDRRLVADVHAFRRWKHLAANRHDAAVSWRSGIKHDCASVLELTERAGKLWNKLGEIVRVESEYLFPLLKSSDLAGRRKNPKRWVIVPQRQWGDDNSDLARSAPRTWRYLQSHADRFDARKSVIYRGRGRFSVFGVGDYSFARWKVAISGFYKRLDFSLVPPLAGKPVMLDDTCYFLPCRTRRDAIRVHKLLNSEMSRKFYESLLFWDAKRPITSELLQQLDLVRLEKLLVSEAAAR